jgi:hypothetical protein
LLDPLALALRTLLMHLTVLREWFHAIKDAPAVAAPVFVGRHVLLLRPARRERREIPLAPPAEGKA